MNFIDLKTQYRKIEDDVNQRIKAVLEHGQYILGPETKELEALLADYVGVEHCIGVSSGTDALLVAMMALGVGAGDEVITTPFTFIATGEMIALIGAKPVFVDIEPDTYNIDPGKIEAAITSKTKAIMPVSLYGQCANMDAINAIAKKHALPVIEDGAQSFGATYKGQRSNGLSTVGCTSFFPSKPLGGYGDSGACFTNDAALAKLMREISLHGQDRRYHHPRIGINGRLDTIQAAILIAKMSLFPAEVEARAEIGKRYIELLNEKGGIPVSQGQGRLRTPVVAAGNTSVFAQFTIQVTGREIFTERMQAAGIPTAVHYPVPLNQQPALAGSVGDTPVSEDAATRVVSLPMHPYLEEKELVEITDQVAKALDL